MTERGRGRWVEGYPACARGRSGRGDALHMIEKNNDNSVSPYSIRYMKIS